MYNYLDFEKPVADLEGKILELKKLAESGEAVDVGDEIARLEKRSTDALRDIYKALTPWQKVQVARHPDRPHCLDYVEELFTDFTPLAGDRDFRRGQCHRRRLRALPRRAGRGHRPGEGLRHQEPAEAQFRLGPARGLPQGGAHHGTGRPLSGADGHPGRHGRRLSRHRRGRARPGRGHRPLDLGLPVAAACRRSRSSSAKAARAAPSPSPPPTASTCWSMRSTR